MIDPITGAALIGGFATLAGGVLTNQTNRDSVNSANQATLQSNRETMDFQERMSNSAYQRAMADMKKAGLNPMLAYQQGGASSPHGSATKFEAARADNALAPSVATAIDAYSKGQTIKQAAGQLAVSQANSEGELALKAAQTAATTQSAKNAAIQSSILAAEAKKAKLEGDWAGSKTGQTLFHLNKINEAAGGSLDTLNSAKDLLNPMNLLKELKKPNKKGHGTMQDGTVFDLKTGEIKP